MKHIAIRKEPNGSLYMDREFFDRYTEEDLERYGYVKVLAPEDCEITDFNDDLSFSTKKYNDRKNSIELRKEQGELKIWFEEYDNQIKQYQRCLRLGIEYDRDIVELDNQAKVNQERLREIKNILGI